MDGTDGALAELVHRLPDATFVTDPGGTIQAANAAAHALLGARTGGSVVDLDLRDESGREWWGCEQIPRSMASVRGVLERRLTAGLTARPVLLTAAYIRTDGILVDVVVSLRDTRARDRIERTHADLISTVAHELRSPLTSVKGFSATMLSRWDRFTDEQKKQMLAWINADADRVTRLLAELLDVSRIDAGRLELHTQVVDLSAAAAKIIAGRVAAGDDAARFNVQRTGVAPELWLDPDKIEQIFANLVENAVRHGAGTITITITALTAGASITVDDEGPGVPADVAPRIFSKFYRGKATAGGTGLGLYIVRGLAEAHGGTVAVGSSPGGGARFVVQLPAGSPSYTL